MLTKVSLPFILDTAAAPAGALCPLLVALVHNITGEHELPCRSLKCTEVFCSGAWRFVLFQKVLCYAVLCELCCISCYLS